MTDVGERRACLAAESSSRECARGGGGGGYTDASSCHLSRIADSDAIKQT